MRPPRGSDSRSPCRRRGGLIRWLRRRRGRAAFGFAHEHRLGRPGQANRVPGAGIRNGEGVRQRPLDAPRQVLFELGSVGGRAAGADPRGVDGAGSPRDPHPGCALAKDGNRVEQTPSAF